MDLEPSPFTHVPETLGPLDGGRTRSRRIPRLALRAVVAGWKFLVGVLCCLNPVAAVAAAGWVYRAARRSAVKVWWNRRRDALEGEDFRASVAAVPALAQFERWPNWIMGQGGADVEEAGRVKALLVRGFGSLVANLWVGFRGVVTTFVFTLPSGIAMLFSWYAGWNNSFYKNYEEHWVGSILGLFGIGLLIVAMTYVPMAQARFAVTGNWKACFEFRKVRFLIRRSWFRCFLLGVGYALLAAPFMAAEILRSSASNSFPSIVSASPAEQLNWLNGFFLLWALWVFPAFLFLKLAAARVYARAVMEAVRSGHWSAGDLSRTERDTLGAFGLDRPEPPRPPAPLPVRTLWWTGTTAGRTTAWLLSLGIWFVFAAQLYIIQFFVAEPVAWWLKHPLVQLPWFRHVPAHLEAAAAER